MKRRYGMWAGNPKGHLEDEGRCITPVYGDDWYSHQCRRPRGWGTNGLFCKQHADVKKKYTEINNG